MASLSNTPAQYLKRHLARKSRVLLINPPVQERRYHWIRWNQPSDVLRLSTWIKKHCAGADVRLFDFMLPDEAGAVPKHKVKETWTGAENDAQLWHFGTPFESFERYLSSALTTDWCPDLILITSLTSYWHVPIEKLLIKICSLLGKQRRKQARIALYGNYPRFEAEHAGGQPDADVAFTESVDTRGCCPDFGLYLTASNRLPLFYALDAYTRMCMHTSSIAWAFKVTTNVPAALHGPRRLLSPFLTRTSAVRAAAWRT